MKTSSTPSRRRFLGHGACCLVAGAALPLSAPARAAAPEARTLTVTWELQTPAEGAADNRIAADGITLLCGRFEGVDQRLLDAYAVEEVSLGDFVLTGGEIAAQAMLDATVRLLPGVIGNAESLDEESHSHGLLEHPQYTRPQVWQGLEIPAVLTSGNHAAVAKWRREQAEALTRDRRPDLWAEWLAAEGKP